MVLATLSLAVNDGSRFPQNDEWEMISVLTGNEPVTPSWLWRQHGWWPDPGHHDRWTTEHRTPLFKLAFLWLLELSRADFRSGSVFSVLALGAVAFAMIRTARALRGQQEYADAYFPLALLHWGHSGFLWSQQLYFALSAVLACVMLLMIARRTAPLRAWPAVPFALGLALLVMSGPGGMAYVPALSLVLVGSGVFHWRSGDPERRREGLLILAMSFAVLVLVPLYFVDIEKPIYRTYDRSVRDSLKNGMKFLATGIGPKFFSYTWPYCGMAMLALFAAGSLVLCSLWWTQPKERFRAACLLCFTGGVGSLALAMGWSRGGAWDSANYERHTFLTIPALCCLYLVWSVNRSSVSHIVQMSLFTVFCVALWPNTHYGLELGAWTRSRAERTGRLIQAGIPPAILADLGVMFHLGDFHDQSVAREYAVSRLEMMRKAGIAPYQVLKEKVALAEFSLPVEDFRLTGVSRDDRIMRASGTGTGLAYELAEPRFVYAIRLRYRYRGTGNPALKLFFRTTKEDVISETDMVAHESRTGTEETLERTVAVWVNDTIREILIHIDNKPSTFGLSQVVLILPVSDGGAGPESSSGGNAMPSFLTTSSGESRIPHDEDPLRPVCPSPGRVLIVGESSQRAGGLRRRFGWDSFRGVLPGRVVSVFFSTP
jgi:hypothetical protein